MNFFVQRMQQCARHSIAVIGLLAAAFTAGGAHAGNVGISVGIHVPGAPVYVMPPPPPPRVHYHHPAPPVVHYVPAHGYWAPPPPPRYGYGPYYDKHRGHKHWKKHGPRARHHHHR